MGAPGGGRVSRKLASFKIDYDIEFDTYRLTVFHSGLEPVALHSINGTILKFFHYRFIYGAIGSLNLAISDMNVACCPVRFDIAFQSHLPAKFCLPSLFG